MSRTSYILLGLILAVALMVPAITSLYVDYLWFQEVNYLQVFLTI
jgi:uncharacterized membrane protein (UPF0182 family)